MENILVFWSIYPIHSYLLVGNKNFTMEASKMGGTISKPDVQLKETIKELQRAPLVF